MPGKPRKGESKKAFISRAISDYMNEGMPREQAIAAAFRSWRDRHKEE